MFLRNSYTRTLAQLFSPFQKRRKTYTYNPKRTTSSGGDGPAVYGIFSYGLEGIETRTTTEVSACLSLPETGRNTWINADGLHRDEVEQLCAHFGVHFLLKEDILSIGQRAKADDLESHLFCLLPMLTYNNHTGIVQLEQLSIVLGPNFLLSFQADPEHDPFDNVRQKLKAGTLPLRKKNVDYLAYGLIDAVVDDYFSVLERLSDRLEKLEDEVIARPHKSVLVKITLLRHELMVVKRAITPVRELVNALWHSDNGLIEEGNAKYFKDIYDHICIAIDYADNYREMVVSLQDLYMDQVSARMNEVMKILTVVTTLLAPATVISGIFGMNFATIPFSENPNGFKVIIGIMAAIMLLMLIYFRRKRWF